MTSDFMPIPEIGVKYVKPNGDIIKVTNFYQNNGGVPDYVEYIELSDNSIGEAPMEDWNNLNLKVYTQEPEPNPEPEPRPKTNIGKSSKQDAESENSKKTYNEDVNDFISKVGSVEKLMNRKPVFQAEYYPTDQFSDISDNEMEESDVVQSFQKTLDEIDGLRIDRKCDGIYEFLWWCAGVDRRLIRSCPTDWSKKAGVGGVILGTGLMATLSGGFAMYTVFDSWFAAVVIGLFWGLIIFNFDRYLVNSMVSDGTAKITKDEFYSALPRIIIAIFLGIVISAPIEIKLFDGNINEVLKKSENTFVESEVKKALSEYELELNKYKSDYENAVKDEEKAELRVGIEEGGYVYDPNESDGYQRDDNGKKVCNPRGATYGSRAKELDKLREEKAKITQDKKKDYDNFLINSEKRKENLISQATKNAKDEFKKQIGLIKKYEILQSLTKFYSDEPSEEKPWWKFWAREINGMFWVKLVITLLFIILEIMPVFAKMMQEAGWYDKWIDLEDKTRHSLARAKECNNQNVIITGFLSPYTEYIMGEKIKEERPENGDNPIPFKDRDKKKEKKKITENDNLSLYEHVIRVNTKYLKTLIDKIYIGEIVGNDNDLQNIKQTQNNDNKDASDEAEKIS